MSDREPSVLQGPASRIATGASLEAAAEARSATATGHTSPRRERGKALRFYAAGFWRRCVAGTIDLAIILPVAMILAWVSSEITGIAVPRSRHYGLDFWLDLVLVSDPAMIGASVLLLATALIYALVFQFAWAATPGMRVIGLRIIDLYGDRPSLMRLGVRTLGYAIAVTTLGLGFLWVGFDIERRGLHDWLSATHVVKA